VVVTVPVTLIALFQWGWGDQFIYLMAVYAIIQALDGNVLVPLLFSEAVSLHPVAIICAVLLFGGLWGFWGIFFAIRWRRCSRLCWMPGRTGAECVTDALNVMGLQCSPIQLQALFKAWAAATRHPHAPAPSPHAIPGAAHRPCRSGKVLRSTPRYSLPYSFFSLITSNSWHSASSLSLISSKGSLAWP
jgi:putative permease